MGNGDRQTIHHHQRRRRHHHFFHRNTIFLPMLCRLSIKDITLNHRCNDPKLSDEPSSPKVSCMGQVKRNNRVIGLPAASTARPITTHHHKYSKLKKFFSSKTLLPPPTSSMPATTQSCTAAVAGGRSGSKSCRDSREVCMNNLRRLKMMEDHSKFEQEYVKVVDVGELDPPLPVVKRVAPPGGGRDEVNLWKRRFNGAALKSLQIHQMHMPNMNSQPPKV